MKRLRETLLFAGVLVGAIAMVALPTRAQQANPLPPGDGRDIVAVACSQCHGLNAITQLREGPQAWRHQVYDMVERGAQVSPDEIDTVVKYLTANFGPGIPFPGPSPAPVTLAPGSGSDIVATRCSLCHDVGRVVTVKRSRAAWDTILTRMVYLGAPLNTDQTKTVLQYLSTNYGT